MLPPIIDKHEIIYYIECTITIVRKYITYISILQTAVTFPCEFPKKNFTISKIRIEIPITMATMGISGYKFTQKCRKYVNTNNSEYLPELCYAQLLLLFVFVILPEKLLTLLKLFSVWY